MKRELENLKEYLLSKSNEDAKRPLIYPFFKKLFSKNFKIESDVGNADGYVPGKLIVETKTAHDDWLRGLYQALHYNKLGISAPYICIIAHKFLGIWKINELPKEVLKLADDSDSQKSPSETGKINANKTKPSVRSQIPKASHFLLSKGEFDGIFSKDIDVEIAAFLNTLKNLDEARVPIRLGNFITYIERLNQFFDRPLDAIHCFYAIVGYWSVNSIVSRQGDTQRVTVLDPNRGENSEQIELDSYNFDGFKKFVETHYIFTNEGSGITYDNYFSRFDEVISRLDPDYAKQHGIFFTDHNLSKFAMWFVHERFEKNLSDKFIVFDPAGGSGNLITSLDWRGYMKHKIVSELQPDLLKVIERRMRVHEKHIGNYTIIPKTVNNKGLNFLDKSGEVYLAELDKVLDEKGLRIDKPLAFLLNPPYKNTDENVAAREQVEAEYIIDETILELTGKDAGKERYLAFLGQILNMAKSQHIKYGFNPILMIFTPTSWLIPRPTYVPFKTEFDMHFRFENGFIITSNEFFALKGKWPLAFTIWTYNWNEEGNNNKSKLWDFTHLKREDLAAINWSARIRVIDKNIKDLIRGAKAVNFEGKKRTIKKWAKQKMFDFKRSPSKKEIESGEIYGGLPFVDPRRNNIKTYGISNSSFIGFMDDGTPVRVKQKEKDKRFTGGESVDRIWFRLDNDMKSINKTRCLNGPTDKYSYCAFNLDTAQRFFVWFGISKAIGGKYPLWANQLDIWKPNITTTQANYFYSLCFSFGLAENRCIVTRFEGNNPVDGVPEVLVDNPMSTNNPDSFWNLVLDENIVETPNIALDLTEAIKELYSYWAKKYCMKGIIWRVGLKEEPYFKYFNYDDFLTPNSGLVQIRKYAEINKNADLLEYFEDISKKTKSVREEIYRLLVEEFKYFE